MEAGQSLRERVLCNRWADPPRSGPQQREDTRSGGAARSAALISTRTIRQWMALFTCPCQLMCDRRPTRQLRRDIGVFQPV